MEINNKEQLAFTDKGQLFFYFGVMKTYHSNISLLLYNYFSKFTKHLVYLLYKLSVGKV